jgi:hypothetical protein
VKDDGGLAQDASVAEADDGTDNYSSYMEYNKVLRSWFVAFGIGGPALLLVNTHIATSLKNGGCLRYVALLLLSGVAAQVAGALLNKHINWYVYDGKT